MNRILEEQVAQMRSFNRFYTNLIGLLNNHIYESPYSLTEVRVLYEINNGANVTARGIMETISIDEAYLSRIILKFQKEKLLKKEQSKTDKRVYYISATEKGRKIFGTLNDRSQESLKNLLDKLSATERATLINHLQQVQQLLNKTV
jgi:DNA-binding MarR family transcriptional regulator